MGRLDKSIASIVAGGTASELTGGKFKNGATTAAFMATARILGAAMHKENRPAIPDGYVEVSIRTADDYKHAMDGLNALVDDPEVDQHSLALARFEASVSSARKAAFFNASEHSMLVLRTQKMREDLQSDVLKIWEWMALGGSGATGLYTLGRGGAYLWANSTLREKGVACIGAGVLVCGAHMADGFLKIEPAAGQFYSRTAQIQNIVRREIEKARQVWNTFWAPK